MSDTTSMTCFDFDEMRDELPPLVDEEEGCDMELTRKPTCRHNQWVRVSRMTGTVVYLQCRVCGCDWGTDLEWHTKCADHFAGKCEKGEQCPHAHIYRVQSKRRKAWKKLMSAPKNDSFDQPQQVPTPPLCPTPPTPPTATYTTTNIFPTHQIVYLQQPAQPRFFQLAYPPSPTQVVLLSLPQALPQAC
eukprot:TRINITY_DN38022_c0_g1_i1.p2 TRINITY_DN38022_c0_g1~~TRINITY_DN38022_c0_g1_i1.p2  ORF type:complete len:209 (+),score=42.70 TRINITY_DN38022_c0_g1_i1:63-629(+)